MVDQPQGQDTPQGTGTLGGKREPPAYYAYLLRLWRVAEMGQPVVWRGSLQAARNGAILGFASLDELFEFLRRLTGMTSDTAEDEDEAKA
jgi:hypothetical protein